MKGEVISMPAWWFFCLAAVGLLFIVLAAAGCEKDALLVGFGLASSAAGVVLARLIKGPQRPVTKGDMKTEQEIRDALALMDAAYLGSETIKAVQSSDAVVASGAATVLGTTSTLCWVLGQPGTPLELILEHAYRRVEGKKR